MVVGLPTIAKMCPRSLFISLLLLFVLLAAPARAEDGEVTDQASSSEQTPDDTADAQAPGAVAKPAGLPSVGHSLILRC